VGMTGPGWLGWLFAVVMLGTAAYCAGRLAVAWRSRRPTGYAVDLTHILMGSAMAGMLVPGLGFAPAGLWRATFAAAGCWFAAQAVRGLTRGGPARAGLTAGGPASATAGSQAANVPADGGSARRSWIPGSPIHGVPGRPPRPPRHRQPPRTVGRGAEHHSREQPPQPAGPGHLHGPAPSAVARGPGAPREAGVTEDPDEPGLARVALGSAGSAGSADPAEAVRARRLGQ